MQACSFLGTLGRARVVVSDRREVRAVDGDAAWDPVADVHDSVRDLVDLCTAGLPLPPLDHSPPSEADDAVAAILEDRYRELSDREVCTDGGGEWDPDEDTSEPTDDPPGTQYDVYRRIDTVDGEPVVPLRRTGPTAANWYVLGDVLPSYASAVAADCRTLADRQRLCGSPAVGKEWTAVADLLSAVASFVDYQSALARWIHVPDRDSVVAADQARDVADRLTNETRNLR
ncbi:hypothetical protein [Haloparvum sp. PAK95]|uniref:hypothetical protein n=1 Tax=Haloparvum sp. PAK95 TaxID=3418962 RepID=UPI003D2EF7F2